MILFKRFYLIGKKGLYFTGGPGLTPLDQFGSIEAAKKFIVKSKARKYADRLFKGKYYYSKIEIIHCPGKVVVKPRTNESGIRVYDKIKFKMPNVK